MTAEPTRWATRLYDAYVFDMDGTIYLGDHLLPGARRLIEEHFDSRAQAEVLAAWQSGPRPAPAAPTASLTDQEGAA